MKTGLITQERPHSMGIHFNIVHKHMFQSICTCRINGMKILWHLLWYDHLSNPVYIIYMCSSFNEQTKTQTFISLLIFFSHMFLISIQTKINRMRLTHCIFFIISGNKWGKKSTNTGQVSTPNMNVT